jgi:hypothetical protein
MVRLDVVLLGAKAPAAIDAFHPIEVGRLTQP